MEDSTQPSHHTPLNAHTASPPCLLLAEGAEGLNCRNGAVTPAPASQRPLGHHVSSPVQAQSTLMPAVGILLPREHCLQPVSGVLEAHKPHKLKHRYLPATHT